MTIDNSDKMEHTMDTKRNLAMTRVSSIGTGSSISFGTVATSVSRELQPVTKIGTTLLIELREGAMGKGSKQTGEVLGSLSRFARMGREGSGASPTAVAAAAQHDVVSQQERNDLPPSVVRVLARQRVQQLLTHR